MQNTKRPAASTNPSVSQGSLQQEDSLEIEQQLDAVPQTGTGGLLTALNPDVSLAEDFTMRPDTSTRGRRASANSPFSMCTCS